MQKSMGKEPENEINDMQKNDAMICIPEFTMANYTARTNANVFCASMVVLDNKHLPSYSYNKTMFIFLSVRQSFHKVLFSLLEKKFDTQFFLNAYYQCQRVQFGWVVCTGTMSYYFLLVSVSKYSKS